MANKKTGAKSARSRKTAENKAAAEAQAEVQARIDEGFEKAYSSGDGGQEAIELTRAGVAVDGEPCALFDDLQDPEAPAWEGVGDSPRPIIRRLNGGDPEGPRDVKATVNGLPWDDGTGDFSTTNLGPTAEEAMLAEAKGGAKHRVTVMRDHGLEYPDLYLEVFIAGDKYEEARFAEMLSRSRCTKARSLAEADFCIFTGGPDVDPQLYGEQPHLKTRWSSDRDSADIVTYLFCMERGIPMLGVCRGAQFLHVMNGGKLYQDVDNHNGDHHMLDLRNGEIITKVSSVHHQMVRPNVGSIDIKTKKRTGNMEILATTTKSRTRWTSPKDSEKGANPDIEAFFYRDTCCLGVQGHPEYKGYNYYAIWVLKQINDFFLVNPDTDWVKDKSSPCCGHRRLKADILALRQPQIQLKVSNTNTGAK